MTWTRKSNQPLTNESRVLVSNDAGEEGWASVTWGNGSPRLFGCVTREERAIGADGCDIGEPKITVLDRDPTFS